MTTVRIPEGRRTPFPWRRTLLIGGWALSLIIVAGALGWYLLECRNDNAVLTAEIVNLKARIAGLNAEKTALIQQNAETVAALIQQSAELSAELADCQNEVKSLVQRADRLEAELDACLIALNQPQRVQTVLPGLLRDNTTTIFVVDDSGSMGGEIVKVQEALQKVQQKPAVNARLSIMLFGNSYTTLFNFTDPATAPWDYAIGEIKAAHGGTDISLALQAAYDSIKDEPDASKRIVLLTDGHGFIDAETLVEIQNARIPIDTIAFGPLADHRLLAQVAQATGGDFAAAN